MSRAQFDRLEVVNQSMQLFWQAGYSATSIKDISKATGLRPGSLYLAFTNKENLYRETLDTYASNGLAAMQNTLEQAENVGLGIINILERIINDAENKHYCSCFLIKSQLELTGENAALRDIASAHLAKTEALFAEYLNKQYNLEQAQIYAKNVMLHIFGVRVYSYQKQAMHNMHDIIKAGLPWLPWQN